MGDNIKVPAVERALDILEYLSECSSPKTLKELGEGLDIPAASLFRLVKNLVARNYLLQVRENPPEYVIGYMLNQLTLKYAERYTILNVVKPYLEELSRKTNQTAQFAVLNGNDFIYIDQVLSGASLNFIAQLYMPVNVNTSAGAKCILAQKPYETQKSYLEGLELKGETPNTITDKEKLLEELQITAERGWGIDNEEYKAGIACLAAPIFDMNRECVGAIGVTGSAEEYQKPEDFEYLKEMVTKTASEIFKR